MALSCSRDKHVPSVCSVDNEILLIAKIFNENLTKIFLRVLRVVRGCF